MTEIVLNPDQAKRLSELIKTVAKPLPTAYAELVEAIDIGADSADDGEPAYIDLTIQLEDED